MQFLPLFNAALAGCLWMAVLAQRQPLAPARLRWLLIPSFGIAAGCGAASFLHFLLLAGGLAGPAAVLLSDAALALVPMSLWLRARRKPIPASGADSPAPFRYNWLLAIVLLAGLAFVLAAHLDSLRTRPHGDWDAFSIWNVRARYLAGPEGSWKTAIAPGLMSHPDYPLLVSGLVARCWTAGGTFDTLAPAAAATIFFLASVGVLTGALATLASLSVGLLAGLVLMATSPWLALSASQYSDIPLGLYMAGGLAAAFIGARSEDGWGWMALGGFLCSCAAWTKNEGLPFALFALLSFPLSGKRRAVIPLWLGSLPGLLVVAVFKLVYAPPGDVLAGQSAAQTLAKFADLSRYSQVFEAVYRQIIDLGSGPSHPLLLLVLLGLVLRFQARAATPLLYWAGGVLLLQIATYGAVYVATPHDLNWLLGTSLSRLFAQVWPAGLLTLFSALNPPERCLDEPTPTRPHPSARRKKK